MAMIIDRPRRRLLAALLACGLALGTALPAAAGDGWIEAGLDPAGREGLRRAFAEAIDKALIAGGSLLLYKDGKEIFNEAFGKADLGTGRPFTTGEVVALASISKPHTATTIMRLVERGLLALDEPISARIPAFAGVKLKSGAPARAPTLRQLLSHTAGFPGLQVPYMPLIYGEPSMAEAVAAIIEAGLAYEPGTDYAYNELGFVVAAHAAELATGKDFEIVMQEELLAPLGIEGTTFFPPPELIATMPVRYNRVEGKLVPEAPRAFRPIGMTFDPAGSLVARADGVAKLFRLHLGLGTLEGTTLLSPETIRTMQTVQPAAENYGLGLNLQWLPKDGTKPIIRHGGASGTMAWADYELGIVGVLLTQTPWRQVPEWSRLFYAALHEAGIGRMVDPLAGVQEQGR